MRFFLEGQQAASQRLLQISERIANPSFFLHAAAQHQYQSIGANFDARGRPEAWRPRVWSVLENRQKPDPFTHPLLERTGHLRAHSTGGGIERIAIGTQRSQIDFGTGIHYARYLQGGTRKMIARPFLMFQPEDLAWHIETARLFLWGL